MELKSKDYHDYVIRDGKFIGKFEEMYQDIEDPWNIGDAVKHIQNDMMLYLIKRHKIKGNILDIGCGKGALANRLKKATKSKILAIDISPTAIKKAKEKYKNIDFRVMDIQKKNIKKKFNLIVISATIWYFLPKFREIMNYLINNVLKKGGYLLINQGFYPEKQKYGRDIIKTPDDMISLINLPLIEMIETNRTRDYAAIALFRKIK